MSLDLIIVESPAKCSKIEGFLGRGYKCLASFGHIRQLNTKKGLKCIDIDNNFTPDFVISHGSSKQIQKIKNYIPKARKIYLATDDDREGEAIAWHLCKVLKLDIKTNPRIIFHEITKQAIVKAVNNPTTIDMNKVNSQQARQILDLLVGFSISPMLWKHISNFNKDSLSAGRCQTPALRLVYDNHTEIKKNPGSFKYKISGIFTKKNIHFLLNQDLNDYDTSKSFLSDTKTHIHKFRKEKMRESEKKPPVPFTTSGLQQKASSNLGFSPKKTMTLCQKLYEAGYITYMRTDSKVYSTEFIESTYQHISQIYGDLYNMIDTSHLILEKKKSSSHSNNKKSQKQKKKDENIQEAHESIRPTKITVHDIDSQKNKQLCSQCQRLYKFIWKNSMQSLMANSKYHNIKCIVSSPIESNDYSSNISKCIFKGWEILDFIDEKYKEQIDTYDYIDKLKSKGKIKYNSIQAICSLKEKKLHLNEAKLVSLLEEKGIGRPSTYSSLVSKIQEKNYVKLDNVDGFQKEVIDMFLSNDGSIEERKETKIFGSEKNKLIIKPLGLMVCEYLYNNFQELFNYDYTKDMETNLDKINERKLTKQTLLEDCYNLIQKYKENTNEMNKITIQIDENHKYMIARYGPVIQRKIDGKITYLKVIPNIDIHQLEKGGYNLEDIIIKQEHKENSILGEFIDKPIFLKKGNYGFYIQHDGKNHSLSKIMGNKHLASRKHKLQDGDIDIDKIMIYLRNPTEFTSKTSNVLRTVSDYVSINKGKYGNYIYYKSKGMTKPLFLKLKGFSEDPLTCDISILKSWIDETYGVK